MPWLSSKQVARPIQIHQSVCKRNTGQKAWLFLQLLIFLCTTFSFRQRTNWNKKYGLWKMKEGKGSDRERERDNVNLICPWTQWLSLFLMYYENMKLCGKLVQNYFYIFWDLGTKTKHITIQWSFFKNLFTKLGNWNHLFSGIVFTSLGSRKIDHKFHFCSTLNDPQNKTYAF